MKQLFFLASACSLLANATAAPVPPEALGTPNFVFILADDMGYGDVAHAGGKFPTPHLDRLRSEGMRFTDAHTTSSVCTPTRYGILTGRYNWRSPLKKSVLFPPLPSIMDPERPTVAKFLQTQGYTTFAVGKWHLGLNWHMLDKPAKAASGPTQGNCWDIDFSKPPKLGPLKVGFTHDFLFPASLDMAPYLYLRDDVPVGKPTVTKGWNRKGPATPEFEADQCLTDFARESRAFIRQGATSKKPFFLYLPLTSPHTPIVPSKKWQGKSGFGQYGDFVMETDWVVGEVLAELEAQGVADNTFVLFTADNGCSPQAKIPELAKQGHKCNGDWRGHKADIYEGGHRVPFLVRWPGQVKADSSCDLTACTADFFATAVEILGQSKKLPNNVAEDSYSLVHALRHPGRQTPIRPFTIHHSINGSFAIRKGDWKLCLCPGSGGWSDPRPNKALKDDSLPAVQLFHLGKDPAEKNNVEAQHPAVVKDLVATLVHAIEAGRTREGLPVANDGWPDTFPEKVVARFPALQAK